MAHPSLQHNSTETVLHWSVSCFFKYFLVHKGFFFINYCSSYHFNHQRLKTALRENCLLLSLIHTLKEVLVNLLSVFLWNKHVSLVQLLLWSYKRRSKYVTDFNSSNFSLKFCPSQQARNQPTGSYTTHRHSVTLFRAGTLYGIYTHASDIPLSLKLSCTARLRAAV